MSQAVQNVAENGAGCFDHSFRARLTSAVARSYRLVLPAAFLGYALFYGATLVEPTGYALRTWALEGTSWADGSAPQAIDQLIANQAPHFELAFNALGYARFAAFGEMKPGAVAGRDGYLFNQADLILAREVDAGVSKAVSVITSVADQLEALGIDLVFLPLPTKMDVERDHHGYEEAAQAGERAYRAIVQSTLAAGVTTIDARSAWLEARLTGPVTHRTDQHWTVLGAQIAAREIARKIDMTGFMQVPIVLEQVSETLPFQGDLAAFIGSEYVSTAVGYPLEMIRPYNASGADPGPSEIALVGTSESVDLRWSFEVSLEHQLQAPIDNQAMSGVGPVLPMWRAIHQYRTAPEMRPRLVIWEFPVGAAFKENEIDVDQ